MKLQSYKELVVWQKSLLLVSLIYKLTRELPTIEQFGLSSQMQRAAVTIPSNIAEGYDRQHHKEFIQFLSIAQGSACELETQLIICNDVYPNTSQHVSKCLPQLEEIQKMLRALIVSLNRTKS